MTDAGAWTPNFKAYAEGAPIPPVDPEDLKRRWNIKVPWTLQDLQEAWSHEADSSAVSSRWQMIDTLIVYKLLTPWQHANELDDAVFRIAATFPLRELKLKSYKIPGDERFGFEVELTQADSVEQLFTLPKASASISHNFDGIPDSANGLLVVPPDENLAVGATQIVEVINSAYQVFNKSSGDPCRHRSRSGAFLQVSAGCAVRDQITRIQSCSITRRRGVGLSPLLPPTTGFAPETNASPCPVLRTRPVPITGTLSVLSRLIRSASRGSRCSELTRAYSVFCSRTMVSRLTRSRGRILSFTSSLLESSSRK
jgi:hypothetical protein